MYCDWPVLGRCCFCMPLRRGILTFAYLNLFFSSFMMGVYSYSIHTDYGLFGIYHGASVNIPAEICVALYCLELVFDVILIYGTHKKLMNYIKIYYYFALVTIVASFLMQLIELTGSIANHRIHIFFEIGPLMFASICIQIYLIILIRSLLQKMNVSSGPNIYDNPLQQIVYEGKVDNNGVYDPTVVPVNA